jgi:hypothetical protein
MKKLLLMLPLLLYWSCDEPTEDDTTPPTVSITLSPIDYVSEIVTITCVSTDNEGVDKVELWVNGVSTGVSDNTEPYSLDWNTTTYEDGSYVITVRSYDTSGNTTDSDPITLTVDNSGSYPTPVLLYSIFSQDGSFTITWSQNNDEDFSSYELYESTSEDMTDETLIYETNERTDTSYVVTDIGEDELRYYKVVVEDLWGLQSESNIIYVDSTPLTGTYKPIMVLYQANDCYAYDPYPDSVWFFQLTMNTYQEYFWSEDDECWIESTIWSFDLDYENNMFHTDMMIYPNGDTLQIEFGWELNGDSLFWYWIDIGENWDSNFQCNGNYWEPVSVPFIIALRDDIIDFSPLCDTTTSQSLINSRKKWIE